MRSIYETFTEDEFKLLTKLKRKKQGLRNRYSWKTFILEMAKECNKRK